MSPSALIRDDQDPVSPQGGRFAHDRIDTQRPSFMWPRKVEPGEHYLHRIGRTARWGKNGCAPSFLGPEDMDGGHLLSGEKRTARFAPERRRNCKAVQQR